MIHRNGKNPSSGVIYINGLRLTSFTECHLSYPPAPPPDLPAERLKPFTWSGEFTCEITRQDWARAFPLQRPTWKQWSRCFYVRPKIAERQFKKALRRAWVRYQGGQERLQNEGRYLLDRDYYPLAASEVSA